MTATSRPGAAYDRFLAEEAPSSRSQRVWDPSDGPMPALYLSHGSPALFEDETWIRELFSWGQRLPKPVAILIVSAHWESAPLTLSATAAGTPLVYDFGGFPQRYFEMTYETPDASALAHRVAASMAADEPVYEHISRGLDHGAWVPLMTMYPYGDVPVLQLSLPTLAPERLLAVGRRLRALRDEGVLVIGSGFMTHGVRHLTRESFEHNLVPSWSSDFDAWAAEALEVGDVETLSAFLDRAPAVHLAHPTVEHYAPLFVTLGAATDPAAPPRTTITGYRFGLSKRSFEVA